MHPFESVRFANPSGSHRFAREARTAIDDARERVADIIGATPGEIVFTSGGTEGANTAILGAVRRHGGVPVCSAIEHHAVLHPVEHVGGVVVPVTSTGRVDHEALVATLMSRDDISVVSVMAVNNEVGVIQDLVEISRVIRVHAPRAIIHTDAVQAACWLPLDSLWPHVDVLTVSAHKFGGPKGVGVMALRQGITVEPLLLGGGQERDRRSGTHNVAGIVGASVALEVTARHREQESVRIGQLAAQLRDGITSAVDCAQVTVDPALTVPGIVHLCLDGLENEELLYLLDEERVCVSAASACASGAMEPSHVLAAMGVSRQRARGSLRFSLGHTTTEHDIETAVRVTVAAAHRLHSARGGVR